MAHSPQDKSSQNRRSNDKDSNGDVNNNIYMYACQDENLTRCPSCGIIREGVKVTLSDELRYLFVERRRVLILELDAIEEVIGYSPTTCTLRRWWKQQNK